MSWPEILPGPGDTHAGEPAFGDPRKEAQLALEGTVASPLVHLGTIAASGADATTFLQGQLSNDIRKLDSGTAQLSSCNSPKGRLLAVVHTYRHGDGYRLEMHRSVLEATLKRLRMYVLRAKITLEDASNQVAIMGVSGPDAAAILADAGWPVPREVMGCTWRDDACVMRRHDANGRLRFTIHAPPHRATEAWEALAARGAQPVGPAAWRLLDIEAGVPVVYPETSDRFVAQMCNLDRLGGISFDKGCYTGQEVIARVHYRGAVKRHMSAIDHPDPELKPGTRLEDPPGAEVVETAPAPDGGSRALVVTRD